MLEQNPAPEPSVPIAEIAPSLRPGIRPMKAAGERATGVDVEVLYVQYRTLLLSVACRKFRVPDADAEGLLQEVFLSFLQTGAQIDSVRSWLVAAMCNASRHTGHAHAVNAHAGFAVMTARRRRGRSSADLRNAEAARPLPRRWTSQGPRRRAPGSSR